MVALVSLLPGVARRLQGVKVDPLIASAFGDFAGINGQSNDPRAGALSNVSTETRSGSQRLCESASDAVAPGPSTVRRSYKVTSKHEVDSEWGASISFCRTPLNSLNIHQQWNGSCERTVTYVHQDGFRSGVLVCLCFAVAATAHQATDGDCRQQEKAHGAIQISAPFANAPQAPQREGQRQCADACRRQHCRRLWGGGGDRE